MKPRRAAFCALLLGAVASAAAQERVFVSTADDGLPVYTNAPQPGRSVLLMQFQPARVRPPQRLGPAPVPPRLPDAPLQAPAQVSAALRSAAFQTGLPEPLLRAVAQVESGYDHRARSPAGAVGLMQLMPATAQQYGVADLAGLTDPLRNADAGARHLRGLLQRFDGDLPLALAAYNAGEAAVRRHGNRVPPFPETQAYVPAVLARWRLEQRRAQ